MKQFVCNRVLQLAAFLGIVLVLATITIPIHSQTVAGSINGTVTDSSGAVVPNVAIQIKNEVTGTIRTATTSSVGSYLVSQLGPGQYQVTASAKGFITQVRNGVLLLANAAPTIDFTMSIGSVATVVTINATAATLDTTSATLNQVVDGHEMVDLPLDGRNFAQLAFLTPGAVNQEDGQQGTRVSTGAFTNSPSIDGQRGEMNNFTMDGVLNNNNYLSVWAIAPPPDAIQEFSIVSHATNAQFGVSSGASINIVTKSGTNQFHGALWEFLRNNAFDAEQDSFGQATANPPYHQNQYGLQFDGPVPFPHLRGNTWFSGYWESFRSSTSGPNFLTVPTQAEIGGDFSAWNGTIYDPNTTNPITGLRQQFTTPNVIPSGRISAAAQLLFKDFYPLPNISPTNPNISNNFFYEAPTTADSDQAGIRIDHKFGENDQVFGRFNRSNANGVSDAGLLPGNSLIDQNYARSVVVGYTHMFNPRILLNVRYQYLLQNNPYGYQPDGTAFTSNFGNFQELFNPPDAPGTGPYLYFTANGYSPHIQAYYHLGDPMRTNEGHVYLTLVRGRHTITVGGMIEGVHDLMDGVDALMEVGQNPTSDNGTADTTGNSAASFLLGLPSFYTTTSGLTSALLDIPWYAAYVQDEWQVSQRLTLNLGMRYDYVAPPSWGQGVNIHSGFDQDTNSFVVSAPVLPLFPAANIRSSFFAPDYGGWQPRFGFAYSIPSRTVVRGAFSIYDNHDNNLIQQSQNIRDSWPLGYSLTATNLNQGVPTVTLNTLPSSAAYESTILTSPTFPSDSADPNAKTPYVMEYNFGFERQLASSLLFEADYVGSLGRRQQLIGTANTARTPGPGSLASRGQPLPAFAPLQYSFNRGDSSYNALQAKLSQRYKYGLDFLMSYTYSKSMDVQSAAENDAGTISNFYNPRADWGPSDFDRRHVFTWGGTYQLPFGKGKTYLGGAKGIENAVIGGWNASGVVSLTSGEPFSALASGDVANVGGGTQRAEQVGNPNSGFTRSVNEWFNKAAFTQPAPYTFGNLSRNTLTGPPLKNFDLAVFKDFALPENARLQFRSEFFNAFNHPNLGLPDNNVTDPGFGAIRGAGSPRLIQFALKLLF